METKTVLAQGAVDQTIQNVFGPFVDVLEKVVFFAIPIGDDAGLF